MRFKNIFVLLITVIAAVEIQSSCCQADAQKRADSISLRVAAAADLTDAFKEIAEAFSKKAGIHIDLIFGASGQLTQQIEHGAPFDVFASASKSYIDEISSKHLTHPDTEKIYAIGKLVVWSPPDSKIAVHKMADLISTNINHISIANPEHAPYGKAAVEALTASNLYPLVKPKLVYGENVRQALQFCQSGNAEIAIVSAAIVIGKGHSLPVPVSLYRPLEQSIAVLKSSMHENEARQFTRFVSSPDGTGILKKYGFRFQPKKN